MIGAWSFIGNIEWRLNCFHQNNAHLYGLCDYPTGIDESRGSNDIDLFPNPSNGKFQVAMENDRFNTIEISNVLGRTIHRSELKDKITEIDISTEIPGIYFVRISDGKGNVVIKKIVKE